MKKIAIIGGDNHKGYNQKLKAYDCDVKYHDGRMKRTGTKNFFSHLLKDADCVILILSAVSHGTMYAVKEVASELGIKVVYQRSKGISGVLQAVHDNVAF